MITDGAAAACTGKCMEADIGSRVVIAVAVGLFCSGVFVALKLYSRIILTKRAGSDDALIVISFCAAVAMSAMLIEGWWHCFMSQKDITNLVSRTKTWPRQT